MSPRLSVIVVTYDSAAAVARCLPRAGRAARARRRADRRRQRLARRHPGGRARRRARRPRARGPSATRLRRRLQRRRGRRAAATCSSSSTPTPCRRPASSRRSAAPRRTAAAGRRGWALVTMDGGTRDQHERRRHPLHRDRLGRRGAAAGRGGAARGRARCRSSRAPASRSRVRAWSALGGFAERYFMYCEDVDLSLRAAAGGRAHRRRARGAAWTTTTTSPRARRSGGCWSATAGRCSCATTRARCSRCSRPRCWPRSSRCWPIAAAGGWLPQKLPRRRDAAARSRACCASAARCRPRGRSARRVRPLAHARPRLRLPRPRGHPRPAALGAARLLAARHGGAERGRIGMRSSGPVLSVVYTEQRSVGIQSSAASGCRAGAASGVPRCG